jgi:hypothetical protein
LKWALSSSLLGRVALQLNRHLGQRTRIFMLLDH